MDQVSIYYKFYQQFQIFLNRNLIQFLKSNLNHSIHFSLLNLFWSMIILNSLFTVTNIIANWSWILRQSVPIQGSRQGRLPCGHCDQIGRFLKFLGNKILSKKSQNDRQLFGLFRNTPLFCKNCIGYFQGTALKKLDYF